LTHDGDLFVDENGDIDLTNGTRQAVRIRLLWFLGEWRFFPETGVPYYEEILTKNPDLESIRRIIRDEVEEVDGVLEARDIRITVNAPMRQAAVTLTVVTSEETYREEVTIDVRLRSDA
jgi:hypothetical protein